jgi:hypothetical protein
MLELTPRAVEALRAADSAAKRFNRRARIRLVRANPGVRADLTDELEPGDAVVELEGFAVDVEPGLDGIVDAGDHQVLTFEPHPS